MQSIRYFTCAWPFPFHSIHTIQNIIFFYLCYILCNFCTTMAKLSWHIYMELKIPIILFPEWEYLSLLCEFSYHSWSSVVGQAWTIKSHTSHDNAPRARNKCMYLIIYVLYHVSCDSCMSWNDPYISVSHVQGILPLGNSAAAAAVFLGNAAAQSGRWQLVHL